MGPPSGWRAGAFVRDASARGTTVLPGEAFAVGHLKVPQMVRVSLGGSGGSRAQLEEGLAILAGILVASGDTTYMPS